MNCKSSHRFHWDFPKSQIYKQKNCTIESPSQLSYKNKSTCPVHDVRIFSCRNLHAPCTTRWVFTAVLLRLVSRRFAGSCAKRPQSLWLRSSSFQLFASSSWDSCSQVVWLFFFFFLNNNFTISQCIGLQLASALCNCCNILPGSLRYTELLSSDLQKNILAALIRLGAVRRVKGYVDFDLACIPVALPIADALNNHPASLLLHVCILSQNTVFSALMDAPDYRPRLKYGLHFWI